MDTTTSAPACSELAEPDVAVWAGEQLVIWGGADRGYENSAVGMVWSPPSP